MGEGGEEGIEGGRELLGGHEADPKLLPVPLGPLDLRRPARGTGRVDGWVGGGTWLNKKADR